MRVKVIGGAYGTVAVYAILVGAGLLAPHQLAAQEALTAPPSPSNAVASKQTDTTDQIEDVVITARKRSENLQEVPVSITNIGAQDIERDNLTNLVNFQSKLPDFTVATSNPKQTNIGVRGIGNNGANNDGIDPSVGVFIDGVYVGRLGEATNDYNDLESINLLRGPQGTLFGKNTVGGALLINSQKPSFQPGVTAEGSLGNYNYYAFKANATGPVVDDKLALRLAAFDTKRDGYEKNTLDGATYDARQSQGARLQGLLTPNDDLSVRLIASHDSQDYNTPVGIFMQPVTVPGKVGNLQTRMAAAGYSLTTGPFDRDISINTPQRSETRTNALTGQVDWDTGTGTITSISGFRDWFFQPYNDNDGTQLDAIRVFGTNNYVQQYSEELRWANPKGEQFETVAGLYAYGQNLKATQQQILGSQYNIYSGTAYAAGTGWGSHYQTQDYADALFGHTTWHATDRLSFNAGLRQTWERKTVNWAGWALPGTTAATVNTINGGTFVTNTHASVKDISLGGEAGASFKITDEAMVYGEYSRGSIAKGVNAPALVNAKALASGATQTINPEKADSFELGTKTEWFDRHLLLNAAVYDELIWGYQTTEAAIVNGSSSSFLANVGSINSRGLELETTIKPTSDLRLTAIGAYNLATYGSFHAAQCPIEAGSGVCDYTGRTAPFAPRFTTDLAAEYQHDLADGIRGYAVADWNWRSSQNLTLTLSKYGQINAYGIANLRIGARLLDDAIDVSLWANNLFDRKYLVAITGNATTEYYTGTPGAPLTVGSTVRVKF